MSDDSAAAEGVDGSADGVDVDEQRRLLRSLWRPHAGQRAVLESDARFRVVAAGRRWGKSEMAAHAALERALGQPGATVWWVAPTYDKANELGYDNITPLLSPDVLDGEPKRTKPRKIRLVNGSVISFRSADREDSLRGGGVDLLVIDEAGSVPGRAWTEELRPTLSDTLGDLLAVGTPRGRNWFWRWHRRGRSSDEDHADVQAWRAPTSQNPHVPDSEVESSRGDMPRRAFRQEYLAEFVDDAGGVFRDVRERNVDDYSLPVRPGRAEGPFAIGMDFGRWDDWTVAAVLDATGRLVAVDRRRHLGWEEIQAVAERLADEYAPATVAADATRDEKVVSDLEREGVAIEPVQFTSRSKRVMVENLVTALEKGEVTLSSDAPELLNELEQFERSTTDAGNVRYAAPDGLKDDCVDALMLAYRAFENASSASGGAWMVTSHTDVGRTGGRRSRTTRGRDLPRDRPDAF